jgi:colanic acid/amylovoran biosynthesis glycosyltransferase
MSSSNRRMHHLAYVFERFPSFTQTFCVREVEQLIRMGVRPLIFSIRDTRAEEIQHFPAELFDLVHFLPGKEELTRTVRQWKDQHQLPRAAALTLREWGDRPDKARVYEAAYIAKVLADLPAGQRPVHLHSHFAGVGARTCWWLRKFSGASYSFTAHANDIFCKPEDETVPFHRLFEDAALIVTVSDFTARQLRERFPAAATRVRRVYNGLDLEPFKRARAAANRTRAAGGITSVGRLIEKKGYPDLIAACALLRARGVDFHCRIVGEGPLEAELRAQIESLHLSEAVTLTGPLGINEIRRLLAEETQVFALACATEQDGGMDNLPTVLMEAMAASLPCVSTILAGVPEMVLDAQTGYLVKERDRVALADRLQTLLRDAALCERMGVAGLRHAEEHFTRDATGRALLAALSELGGLTADSELKTAQPWLRKCLRRRWWRVWSRPLRHRAPRVSGKSFNLTQFMNDQA